MSSQPRIKLNTGASMPAIGLGGWAGLEQETRAQAREWMLQALQSGYRLIDTAFIYGTEVSTGNAIRESGIPREEIFVTTKLDSSQAEIAEQAIDLSLKNLGLDYVDLYLIHWPMPTKKDESGKLITYDTPTVNEIWAQMEKVYASGKAKAIGVSNFSIKTLEQLLQTAKVVPAVNQVELHPYLAQNVLKEFCDKKGIVLTAYTPSGYRTVRSDPLIVELAAKYKVSPAQVIFAWHISRGVSIVPKSSNAERQKENLNLPTLEEEDINRITSLDRNERLCNKADKDGLVMGWTYEKLGW